MRAWPQQPDLYLEPSVIFVKLICFLITADGDLVLLRGHLLHPVNAWIASARSAVVTVDGTHEVRFRMTEQVVAGAPLLGDLRICASRQEVCGDNA